MVTAGMTCPGEIYYSIRSLNFATCNLNKMTNNCNYSGIKNGGTFRLDQLSEQCGADRRPQYVGSAVVLVTLEPRTRKIWSVVGKFWSQSFQSNTSETSRFIELTEQEKSIDAFTPAHLVG